MAIKLNIQNFGAYADANLVLDNSKFDEACTGVREAHKKMDSLFTQQMQKFCGDMHKDVWADGNCSKWFSGEFTSKSKEQLNTIAEQFNNVLKGLDSLWANVASDLSVGKEGDAGSVSSSDNVDVSATQTEKFDDGTSGRRQYTGKAAQTDMDELTTVLEPARQALAEAVSKIGVYDNLGGNTVQASVDSAIGEINGSLSSFSSNISNNVSEVMTMTDDQYNQWAEGLQVSTSA